YGVVLSAKVSYSGTAAALQANLQNAVNSVFGAGNATVSASGANQYDVTFGGQFARTNLMEMTVQSDLQGSAATAAISTVSDGAGKEMQRLTFPSGVNGGSFTIAGGGGGAPQTIAWS